MRRAFFCLALIGFLLAAPGQGQSWSLAQAGLEPAGIASWEIQNQPEPLDLNDDGLPEEVQLDHGRVALRQGSELLWSSPESWQVRSASLGDLNQDGALELVLLVWRPWQPWPVDQVMPYGGRIDAFHDANGMSCHLILIGWRRQAFGERWAGSAMADPLSEIVVADLDGDGRDELAALESRYTDLPGSPARSLTIWKWNGFGFSLVDRMPGQFRHLRVGAEDHKAILVTTP